MYLDRRFVLSDVISFLGGQANGRGKRFYDRNLSTANLELCCFVPWMFRLYSVRLTSFDICLFKILTSNKILIIRQIDFE